MWRSINELKGGCKFIRSQGKVNRAIFRSGCFYFFNLAPGPQKQIERDDTMNTFIFSFFRGFKRWKMLSVCTKVRWKKARKRTIFVHSNIAMRNNAKYLYEKLSDCLRACFSELWILLCMLYENRNTSEVLTSMKFQWNHIQLWNHWL